MSKSRQKGTLAETAVVAYAKLRGFIHAERRALSGKNDRGDIAGIPGVCLEIKNQARFDLAGWTNEAQAEAVNAGAPIWFVVAKRPGKGTLKVDEWYAITTVKVMFDLLASDAGQAS